MKYKGLLTLTATLMALGWSEGVSADTPVTDLFPDTWVAIDGIDRVLPTADDQPLRTDKDRTVGIFYVSWHYDWFYTNFKAP